MSDTRPLAHSAPRHDPRRPQAYSEHVSNVRHGAVGRAEVVVSYALPCAPLGFLDAVAGAGEYHDLGKLGKQNQEALHRGRGTPLPVDHLDAGVAHALVCGNEMAAWLIRAHHHPGLPSMPDEEANLMRTGGRPPYPPPPLRGKRQRSWESPQEREEHSRLIALSDSNLKRYVERHKSVATGPALIETKALHGLTMRLALSCLVDADYEDSARHDTLREPPRPPSPRWAERSEALDRHIAVLPRREPARDAQRQALYDACRTTSLDEGIVSCQAAVGMGKTYAVTRYLLGQAQRHSLRRLIVVAPFTNIITQTVQQLREALVLPDEDPIQIVAEHHHRVEFGSIDARELATLWRSPIVVTTAVQFFETLAACEPVALRKLHEVPGSAIFIDEAHAAIPAHLWPQNWRWLGELVERWYCRVVLASGSLARFWEDEQVIRPRCRLPELTPTDLLSGSSDRERDRVPPCRLADRALTRQELVDRAVETASQNGPLLVILNTVQSAAAVARHLAEQLDGLKMDAHPSQKPLHQRRVLHLSTALSPRDRERILAEIMRRQEVGSAGSNWVLTATSCVEAGVNLDFQCGFRERSSVSSFIQTGGRINRHGNRPGAVLYDFTLALGDPLLTEHPAFSVARGVFTQLWPALRDGADASTIASRAIAMEIGDRGGLVEELTEAENLADYPDVSRRARVIDTDTRTVVVDARLLRLLEGGRRPSPRLIQSRSVQLWARKIDNLGLSTVPHYNDLFAWRGAYDPLFLGVMCGLLRLATPGGAII